MALAYGARVGTSSGSTAATSATITTTAPIPAGALILVSINRVNVNNINTDVTGVTDGSSNTYTSAGHTGDAGQNGTLSLWYCKNAVALASGKTITISGLDLLASNPAWEIAADYMTGQDTVTPFDGETAGNNNAVAWATPALTTTNANDVLWGVYGNNQNEPAAIVQADCNPTSGWTTQAAVTSVGNDLRTAYNIVSATSTTYKFGGTQSVGNIGCYLIAAFKAASGGGANTWNQALTERQSASDIHASQAQRPVAGDTQSALDGLLRNAAKVQGDVQVATDASTRNPAKVAADMTSGADTTGKTATKSAQDAHSVVDVSVRTPQKALFEARSDLDTVTKGAQKATFDIQSGFDSLLKATQAVFGDPVSALDSLSHLWSAHLALYEALSGLDTVQKAILAPLLDRFSARDSLSESNQVLAGQNWSKTLADALSETDVVASLALVKLLGDAYASTEGRLSQIGRPLYDVSSGQDSLRKAVAALLDDAGVFTDVQRRLVQTTLAEVTSSVDRVTAGKVLLLTLLDQVGLLDAEMTTYTKVQYGLLALLTSLVASSLGVNIAFANTSVLGATTSIIAPLGGAATVSNSSALGGVTTLVAANLALSFSIPF